ncbi:MAG: hypothetical protein JJT96_07125 [Opitutales bacterium]|nr:hypothetical protein [Opitutales bacterium]
MQQLLRSAFEKTTVQDRLHSTNPDDNYFTFINYKAERRGFFCGDFFGYEEGRIGQVIKEAFHQEQIDPRALPAPKAADGTNQQFLDGKLYFVCNGDHLIIAQDLHMKAQHLERYLQKMIRHRSQPFPDEQQFTLERSISQKARKAIHGAKKIHLSAPLEYEQKRVGKGDSGKRETGGFISVPAGNAWEAIKGLIGDKLDLTQFTTDGFADPQDIEVTISLAWKKQRGQTVSNQLDTLANTFRHVEDELDFELETHSGRMKKDELRLSHPFSVQHEDDMPDRDDIFEKMINWYGHLVQTGDV